MIQIHRSEPLMRVENKVLKLSRAEHALITMLGMMDNRVTPWDLLLESINCSTEDRDLLWQKIYRLRRKIGASALQGRRQLGYILTGPVYFVNEL